MFIIDYQAGNLTSVARALHHLGHECVISGDPDQLRRAERVIFPGVGAAASCMARLRERGLDQALAEVIKAGVPVLGICIGMQLLFERSEEDGGVECLGHFKGSVRRFPTGQGAYKVPHMGWNQVCMDDDELGADLSDQPCFYFVHSYFCDPACPGELIAESTHGIPFCAGVRRDNCMAVQFHPEKSGPVGLRFLQNFVRII